MSSPVRMEQRTKLSVKNKITALFCANVSFFLRNCLKLSRN